VPGRNLGQLRGPKEGDLELSYGMEERGGGVEDDPVTGRKGDPQRNLFTEE